MSTQICQLNPLAIPLHGTRLIEASAGTGKTYTITGLYIRMLLERDLVPANILVVTYTEAACQELRDGIRARLAEALAAFDRGTADDPFLADLLLKYRHEDRDLTTMRVRLALALMDFDLAAVFTIHGFCLRVLQDGAFESGFPFETEFIENDSELLQQVVDDYWRRGIRQWAPVLTDYLYDQGWTPETLLRRLPELLSAVRNAGMGVLQWDGPRDTATSFQPLLGELGDVWHDERQEIGALLQSKYLSKAAKAYVPRNLERWCGGLDDYFNQGVNRSAPLEAFSKFSQSVLRQGTKKSKAAVTPEHKFFRLCEQLLAQLHGGSRQVLYGLVDHCCQELPKLKESSAIISFDDLLTGVRDGLRTPGAGERLAVQVGARYPVALIDEFQDTDPLQYEIFKTIYQRGRDGEALFLVGDPKQAIYGFRGADIFAYLNAATDSKAGAYTLEFNWRSEPGLVRACNALFSGGKTPFVLPGISFRPALSPNVLRRTLVVEDQDDAPLTFFTFDDQNNRDLAKEAVCGWLVATIRKLLVLAQQGRAFYENKTPNAPATPLTPGDIAILVRSHRDGELVRRHLVESGLSAVIQSRLSVFKTTEAWELNLILQAVARPGDERTIRAALVNRLLGYGAQELLVLVEDELAWDEVVGSFSRYHQLWQDHGVAAMLYQLFLGQGVFERLGQLAGGERVLTNLRHLTELLQSACHSEGLGVDGLLNWYRKRRHDEVSPESSQIRLESDENLIKIVTIHKSKGLQYPLVFCPFLWDSVFLSTQKNEQVVCHDNQGELMVDLGSEQMERRILWRDRERLAEELRLLYVALTRAEHRSYIYWGRVKSRNKWVTATSALHYLLAGHSFKGASVLAELEEIFPDSRLDGVRKVEDLAARADSAIAVVAANSGGVDWKPGQAVTGLEYARRFTRQLDSHLGIRSFSALHMVQGDIEEPDHDAGQDNVVVPGPIEEAGPSIFSFPRGPQAGSCLHGILERFDFMETDESRAQSLIVEQLDHYGFSSDWVGAVRTLLNDMVQIELGGMAGDLKLAQISKEQRLDEMEFYYTVPNISSSELKRCIGGAAVGKRRVGDGNGCGFMKGFIDLVFCWQDKFYIVDYKSNYLGGRVHDYDQQNLTTAIHKAEYDLQYHIYTLALHRYLGCRLKGYDYERHFGGVYYLFLRGMNPQQGSQYGVFYDRPEWSVVNRLDSLTR